MTWTKKPPSEPGYYWWRVIGHGPLHMIHEIDEHGLLDGEPPDNWGGEWWSIRIPEPPESNWDNFEKVRKIER